MSSNCVWLQKIFCWCVNETTLFSFVRSLLRENCRSLRKESKNKLGDRMIKQLLNSVTAKYRDLSVSRTSIICLNLLATDKSQYFAQPRPIIVNYFWTKNLQRLYKVIPYDYYYWVSVVSNSSMGLFRGRYGLIHDTRHLWAPLRTAGIKAMSRGFSRGK